MYSVNNKNKTMNTTSKVLELVRKINSHYYITLSMNSPDVIQKVIMEFLTKEQFEKFCNYINKHERQEDTLSVKHFVNNSETYIKDSDIQDNWSFDTLIESIQFAIE